jgi:hypothetical protein
VEKIAQKTAFFVRFSTMEKLDLQTPKTGLFSGLRRDKNHLKRRRKNTDGREL